MNILFVTWDGPQLSYLEGLFLPIFRRLAGDGFSFHVLQFAWGDKQKLARARLACESAGIPHRLIRVWRKPVAAGSLITAVTGHRAIRRAVREWDIDVVMPRSTLPALSTLLALRGRSLPVVFDADGLPLDERVDFRGQPSSGLVYRFLRDIEAQAVRRASVVLTRSSRAVDILQARAGAGITVERFHVVGNGRDAEQFAPADARARKSVRDDLDIAVKAPLLVYAGSLGQQYCLPEMLVLFDRVLDRRADAHFLILTGSPELVQDELSRFPRIESSVSVLTVAPDEVPGYMAAGDLGLAFRAQSFSMQAVAPIKVGEYLLCGLPVVATAGIGNSSALPSEVSYLLNELSEEWLERVSTWFAETVLLQREALRGRCREVGLERFSLEASVDSYRRAFSMLVDK